jgi:diaminopimelate epimerase
MMPRMIPFAKGHGLGNDYIVMNAADLSAPLTEWQISRICDRNWGVGSDGILLLTEGWDGADFGLRILNPDGSEAEKSGNGLRIFAKYLYDHGHARRDTFTVATKGGRVECRCHVVDGQMNLVTVEMGRLGPQVEHHPAFPKRINVQWARVASRSQLDILIWERGAGWTLASGSSSSAVACAAVKNGLCDHGLVTVRMPGGELSIDVRPDWSIRLKGAVEEIYTGTLTAGFLRTLGV